MKKILRSILLLILVMILTACSSPEKKMLEATELIKTGQRDEAITIFNEIIDKNPKFADAYLELANSYRLIGKRELERETLEKGIIEVKNKSDLQVALANYFMRRLEYEEVEGLLTKVLENDDKHLDAYETLLKYYKIKREDDKIISLYEEYKDKIKSNQGIVTAAFSYLNLEDLPKAQELIDMIDIEKLEDSRLLQELANFYKETDDKDMVLMVARKGINTSRPETFHGIIYGIENEENLNLINMRSDDINGDGKIENVLLMGDGDPRSTSDIIKLVIQEGLTGNVIETISLSEYGGYPGMVTLMDLDQDNISDILVSIHSGGSGGMEFHYCYSYVDNNLVDLFDTFEYGVDFQFLDGFKAEIFSDEIKKAFSVEFEKDRKERYIEEKYYNRSGMMLESDFGYFKGDSLEISYIDELGRYGLMHQTSLVGPSYNSDYIAFLEVRYVFKDGKWTTYDLNVEGYESTVQSIPYKENRQSSSFADDIKFLRETFAMNRQDVIRKYGNLTVSDWDGEYAESAGKLIYVFYDEVTSIWMLNGAKIFGLELEARYNTIKNILGDPIWEGYDDYDDDYKVYYEISGFSLHFSATSKDDKFRLLIKKR